MDSDKFKKEIEVIKENSELNITETDLISFYKLQEEGVIEIHQPLQLYRKFTSTNKLCYDALTEGLKTKDFTYFEYYWSKYLELRSVYFDSMFHFNLVVDTFNDYFGGKASKLSLLSDELVLFLIMDYEIFREYKYNRKHLRSVNYYIHELKVYFKDQKCNLSAKDFLDKLINELSDKILNIYYDALTKSYYQNPCIGDDTHFYYFTILALQFLIPEFKLHIEKEQIKKIHKKFIKN